MHSHKKERPASRLTWNIWKHDSPTMEKQMSLPTQEERHLSFLFFCGYTPTLLQQVSIDKTTAKIHSALRSLCSKMNNTTPATSPVLTMLKNKIKEKLPGWVRGIMVKVQKRENGLGGVKAKEKFQNSSWPVWTEHRYISSAEWVCRA